MTGATLFDDVETDSPLSVGPISKHEAGAIVVANHYLHRRPPMSFAFGLFRGMAVMGVCTYGTPASRHLQMGVCPSDPSVVVELNRLWVDDECPRNTESWFVARTLDLMPPRIVVSYADTAAGHVGYIYRALSWHYAGWTDMERKTPRQDRVVAGGGHPRSASRVGFVDVVRRKPKVRYWTTTGNRDDKRKLRRLCQWPQLSWVEMPPPAPEVEQ